MNYLAHAFLSFEDEAIVVGNLLGDFVKGRAQLEHYPLNIQNGVILHRHIDQFSDNHTVLKQSIQQRLLMILPKLLLANSALKQ